MVKSLENHFLQRCSAFSGVIAVCLAGSGHAQDWGRWQSGSHEFAEQAAWVNQLADGHVATLSLTCAADVPYVTFNFDGTMGEDRVADASLRVGSGLFEGESRYRSTIAEPSWAMVATLDLVEALKTGRAVEVSVDGASHTFELRGSRRAIEDALNGCGTGSGYHQTWDTFFQFAVADASGTVTYQDRPAGEERDLSPAEASSLASEAAVTKPADEVFADEAPMRFSSWGNGGNCSDSCQWIAAEGFITDETPAAFEAFLEDKGLPGPIIYIDSTGGRLAPALELGRRFRELGLSTSVGTTTPNGGSNIIGFTERGTCLSACAYMFLGGVSRSLDGIGMSVHSFEGLENDQDRVLGFHGVSLEPAVLSGALQQDLAMADATGAELDVTGSLIYGAAEVSSGLIVEYLTDMDIDARLLQLAIAANDQTDRLDMKYPSNALLAAFGVLSAHNETYTPFELQIVGKGLVATAIRRGWGFSQDRRATLRLLRACDAPTPWIVYSVGPDSDVAADLSAVMPDPEHDVFTIEVGDAQRPDGTGFYPTATFSRTNDHTQIHSRYVEAFGGTLNQFGDMSMPSFASEDAFTIFVPLSDDWRTLIGAGTSLEWGFHPSVNQVPLLEYTFAEDDMQIAERVNGSCLSIEELALIRY